MTATATETTTHQDDPWRLSAALRVAGDADRARVESRAARFGNTRSRRNRTCRRRRRVPGRCLANRRRGIYDAPLRRRGGVSRFTQADTLVPSSDPQDLSRYTYVGNNPINYNDPTGHDRCADDSGGCGGVHGGPVETPARFYGQVHYGDLNGDGQLCERARSNCGDQFLLGPLGPRDVLPGVDAYFGFDAALLDQLDAKETRDIFEWGAAQLGYPFGTGDGASMGPYNIQLGVAQDVWAGHADEIRGFYDMLGESTGDPTQDWASAAEGEMGRVVAGLHLSDLEARWTEALAGQALATEVSAFEVALLNYRFTDRTVRSFVFNGIDQFGIGGDLEVWRATGVTGG